MLGDADAEAAYFEALGNPSGSSGSYGSNRNASSTDVWAVVGSQIRIRLEALEMDGLRKGQRIQDIEDSMRILKSQIDQLLQSSVIGNGSTGTSGAHLSLEKVIEAKVSTLQARQEEISTNMTDIVPRLEKLEIKCSECKDPEGEETVCVIDDAKDVSAAESVNPELLFKLSSHSYELQESIWDLSLFINSPMLGKGASAIILLDLLILILMVFTFIGIIIANFALADNYSNSVKSQLEKWRLHSGHMMQYSDESTGASMLARVCAQDIGLSESSSQFNIVGNLQAYLPEPEGSCPDLWCSLTSFAFTGPALSLTAILVWHLTCAVEVKNAFLLLRALQKIKHGHRLEVVLSDDTITVTTFPRSRKIGGYIIVFLKLLLNLTLMWAGTAFLVYTVNLQNLLLNCLALEFVLHLDSLIYEALAPTKGKAFVEHCEGFPVGEMPRVAGADLWSLATPPVTVIVVALVHFLWLHPFMLQLRALLDVVCAGNIDFVVKADVSGMLWSVRTPKFGSRLHKYQEWQEQAITRGLANYSQAEAEAAMGYFDSYSASRASNYFALKRASSFPSFAEMNHYNPHLIRSYAAALQDDAAVDDHLAKLLQKSSATCHNIASVLDISAPSCYLDCNISRHPECGPHTDDSSRVRAICKHGCGCFTPFWGTIYKDYAGCGGAGSSQKYQEDLANLNCTDISDQSHGLVKEWVQEYFLKNPEVVGYNLPDPFVANSSFCATAYDQFGHATTSFPALCPVTWGCTTGVFRHQRNQNYCPRACPCNKDRCGALLTATHQLFPPWATIQLRMVSLGPRSTHNPP